MKTAKVVQKIVTSMLKDIEQEQNERLAELEQEFSQENDPSNIRVIMSKVASVREFYFRLYDATVIQLP